MSARRIARALQGVAFLAALLALWEALSRAGAIPAVYLPAPSAIGAVLADQLRQGTLWAPLGGTVRRVVAGWLSATALGVVLGAAIGLNRTARELLVPTLEFIRPLPASALVPAIVLLLGLSEPMVLAVVVLGTIWPVLLETVHGFESADPTLLEAVRLLRLSPWRTLVHVRLPNAVPHILAGARVGIALALILTVVAEMLSSRPGLGFGILLAARSFQAPAVFAGVAWLGLIGIATNQAMVVLETRWLRWRTTHASD